ncbi:MAG TPA: NAD-dependent epimerase/dehydratase family protein, partial [Candidatus Dormibacteraeota bacterium]|nr:NAD-dependent epimerase/dehydratase family protein [Candidatus Dormibacteraeota bacterium]
MKVVIAGGTGFVGRHLGASLAEAGHEVILLSRGGAAGVLPAGVRVISWDPGSEAGEWFQAIAQADGVVNLAGASIGSGRWTKRRMEEILSSRLQATGAIVRAIRNAPVGRRPTVLVSASGIDYYGNRGEETVTEASGPGDSFLAKVSQQWEAAAMAAESPQVRVVTMRTALVFGRGAPAFQLMVLPFKLFAGGPLGSGTQWFTWIHIDDLVGLYRLGLEDRSV